MHSSERLMTFIKKGISLILCILFPIRIVFWILNLLGHKVHPKARIGFSIIWIDSVLNLEESSRIGNLNFIKVNSLSIGTHGYIGSLNKLNGPFDIILDEKAAIGSSNKCYRAPEGISYNKAILRVGIMSKITAHHRIDCIRNVTIGNYSIVAGHDSQLWTHAYYHDKTGSGRFRLDGDIEIGNNTYIGSRCVLNCGITIADNVVVGANSCVSKSLLKPGTYVSQPLRYIEQSADEDVRMKFIKVEGFNICEEVYERKKEPTGFKNK
jgi:acetyltransferase-like isoleucine patch superfamily enzyme